MELEKKDEPVYLKLRAEIIKHFQDTRNGHNYNCTEDHALNLAKQSLAKEKNMGYGLDLSMEEMLLYTPEECVIIMRSRCKVRMQKWLKEVDAD